MSNFLCVCLCLCLSVCVHVKVYPIFIQFSLFETVCNEKCGNIIRAEPSIQCNRFNSARSRLQNAFRTRVFKANIENENEDELAYQSLIIGMWNYFFYPYPCQNDPVPVLVFHFLVIVDSDFYVFDRNLADQQLYHLNFHLKN